MLDYAGALQQMMDHPDVLAKLFQNNFGLEVKKYRILTNGRASRHPFPEELCKRATNPYLDSGFSDDVMEIETRPAIGARLAVRNLRTLEQVIYSQLAKDERLWPLSIAPMKLYDKDLDFVKDNFSREWVAGLHDKLAQKYGLEKQMMRVGVHINFSLNPVLLRGLYQANGGVEKEDWAHFKNRLYFKISQRFMQYRWLFTYLYGATPIVHDRPNGLPDAVDFPVKSIRASHFGDTNMPNETITYDSFNAQVHQLQDLIASGQLFGLKEFYGPVRLRAHGKGLENVVDNGADYLEIRSFDLDPFTRAGISDDTLNFLELFLLDSLVTDMPEDMTEELKVADERNEEIALSAPDYQPDWLMDAATPLINALHKFIYDFHAPHSYQMALTFVGRRLRNPRLTIGGQVGRQLEDGNLLSFGLKIANDAYSSYLNFPYPLQALHKEYSVKAQQLIRAAIELGLVISLPPNRIILKKGDHEENLAADTDFNFDKGPRDFVKALFPELNS